jgi:hypothetical protein
VVDTAVVKLESTKCRLSIIAVLIKLVRSVTFSKAFEILKPAMVSYLFNLAKYTTIACSFKHKTEFHF